MYLALKLIHIAAMVAFLGNIGLALVWKLVPIAQATRQSSRTCCTA